MYATLDRADARMAPVNGRTRLVLTDHRSAAEIEAARELSILFAMIRVLRARQMDDTDPVVFYYAQNKVPEFLVEAVKSAGGRVVVGDDPRWWIDITDDVTSPRPAIQIASEAMAGLGRRVAREASVPLNRDGLATFERTCLPASEDEEIEVDVDFDEEEPGDEEEDSEEDSRDSDGGVARSTAIVSLAAFAGEVLRSEVSSKWVLDEDGSQSFPFVFECSAGDKELRINLLGKGEKLRENGIEDSLAFLVSTVLTMIRAAD